MALVGEVCWRTFTVYLISILSVGPFVYARYHTGDGLSIVSVFLSSITLAIYTTYERYAELERAEFDFDDEPPGFVARVMRKTYPAVAIYCVNEWSAAAAVGTLYQPDWWVATLMAGNVTILATLSWMRLLV